MRMLTFVFNLVVTAWASSALAIDNCDIKSLKTVDILECIKISQTKIDNKLNKQYQLLMNSPIFFHKPLLVDGERAWIDYRNSYCTNVFESVYPGKEAEIERANCIASTTSDRLAELIYIETGVMGGDFYGALDLITSIFPKERKIVISHVEAKVLSEEGSRYVRQNCKLTWSVNQEDVSDCSIRMRFKIL